MRRLLAGSLLCAAAVVLPAPAHGQEPLSQLLVNLIQAEVRLSPPPPGFPSHEAHFLPGSDQTLAPYLFNQQLVTQLATFPIGSPTGGFAFSFDTSTGTFQRATDSFGPAFADRALTNGRGKLTVGANFQYSKYSSFEGRSLTDGDVKFYLTHQDLPGNLFFEGDLVEAALRLKVSSATTTAFATYGVTDAFDLAVAVPFIRVKMDATVDAKVLRHATGEASPIHVFPGGGDAASFSDSGSATGIGDLLVRAKYRFLDDPGGGLAGSIDLRLPSGDSEQLLGTGAASATFTLIGSSSRGKVSPHFNVAFTGTGTSDVTNLSNEFDYKIGAEFVPAPTVTLNADFLGRTLIGAERLTLTDTVHRFMSAGGVPGSVTIQQYVAESRALNLLSLAVGGKFNVTGTLLINANLLVALNNAGVTARLTPVFGFEYAF